MKKFNLHKGPRFSLRVGDIVGIPEGFNNLSISALRHRGVSIGTTTSISSNAEYTFRQLISDYTYDSMSWFIVTLCSQSYTSFVDVQRQSNNNQALKYDLNLKKLFIGFNKDKDRFEPVTCPTDEKLSKKVVGSELSKILAHSVKSSTQSAADKCLARVVVDFDNYLKQIDLTGGGYDFMRGTIDRYYAYGVGLSMLKELSHEYGGRFEKCYDKLAFYNEHHRALSLMFDISSELNTNKNPGLSPDVCLRQLIRVLNSINDVVRYWTSLNAYGATNRVTGFLSDICNERRMDEIYMPSIALPDNCVIIRPSEAGLAYLEKTMAKEFKQQLIGSLKVHIEWTKGIIHPFNELIGRLSTIINKGKQNGERNN